MSLEIVVDHQASPSLVLASASPRRKELLQGLGINFEIHTSDMEELLPKSFVSVSQVVENLASQKAKNVVSRFSKENNRDKISNTFVLAADTVVVLDEEIFGKPIDAEDASRMLKLLSNRKHQVITGVSIYTAQGIEKCLFHCLSYVTFREITNSEREYYINTGEPMDKAGAYAIQGFASAFVDTIEGSYTNIVGLPLSNTILKLRELGFVIMGASGEKE